MGPTASNEQADPNTDPSWDPGADSGRGRPRGFQREALADLARRPVRGGVSIIATLTGGLVVCAATTLFILAAVALATYTGYKPYLLPIGGIHRVGLTMAIGIGLGLFVAHLWGGYTAGRMARGAGWVNGLLAAITAGLLLMVGLIVLVLVRPGLGLGFRFPSDLPRLAFLLPRWIDALAASAIAVAGATIGGIFGVRWHARIELRASKETEEVLEERDAFRDLREALEEPEPPSPTPPLMAAVPVSPAALTPQRATFDPGVIIG